MDRVDLSKPDVDFIREVERESGQILSRCYQCGNCTAGCPMSFTFDHPVSRIMRLIQAGQRNLVLSSKAIWMCASCITCSQRCPNNIDVATVMDVCRHIARRAGIKGAYGVGSFRTSFMDSIKWNGRMHEIGTMAGFMFRTGRFFTDLDLAPKVMPKGKMSIPPHRTEGRAEVRGIMERFAAGLSSEEAALRTLAQSDPKQTEGKK